MTDPAFEAAVAMLQKGDGPAAEAAPTPTPEPAPVPEAPAEAPAEPAPVEAPPVDDSEAKLRADLEARRVNRAQRQPQVDPAVAAMQAKIDALEARLTQPQQANLQAMIAQHGEVEALRQLGVDPLAFFNGFRERAKQQNPAISAAERAAIEAKQATEVLRKRLDERDATEKQSAQRSHQNATEQIYLESTKTAEWSADPGLKLEHIHKLDAQDRLEWTYKTVDHWRDQGVDLSDYTDRQLAKLTDMHFRDRMMSRLTGTDPGSKQPPTVPANDGAKTKQQPAASLTNAVAAQATGRERPMTDEELFAASVRIIESGRG